jgi:hypothetical protein
MSKRSRQPRENAETANNRSAGSENINEARPADHSQSEPKLAVSGAAYLQFGTWIDEQLDELVGRWIHTAAPAAASVRRIMPQESRRSEQS